jgi:hypothetical protein
MKKSTPRRLPLKLVLRAESLAVLTPTQLGEVTGASQLQGCSVRSFGDPCDLIKNGN